MGNVTSNLIENALHSSSSSAVITSPSAASVVTASNTVSSESDDGKLLKDLSTDPTRLELYRLLQQEMENQATSGLMSPASNDSQLRLRRTEMMKGETPSSGRPSESDDCSSTKGQSSGSQATMLCPKKKFLKEYFDEDDSIVDSKTMRTVEDNAMSRDREPTPSAVSAALIASGDAGQSAGRSRSYTVSLPMRSRGGPPHGPPHEARTAGYPGPKSGEQHPGREATMMAAKSFDMNSCIDAVVRSQIVGDSRQQDAPQRPSSESVRNEVRSEVRSTQYVIDREHGPASSVAAYNSARHHPSSSRRDEMSSASLGVSRMTAERQLTREPRHAVHAGEVEGSSMSGSMRNPGVPPATPTTAFYDAKTQSYYYVDHAAANAAKAMLNGDRRAGPQPVAIDQLKSLPSQPGPMSASSYQMELQNAPPGPPNWRSTLSTETQGSRVAAGMSGMSRGAPPTSWPVQHHPPQQQHQQQQHQQQSEMYHRTIEHSRDYEGPGGSAAKYRIMDAPPPSTVGYQYAVEGSGRTTVYDQRAGYPVEQRSKYIPVDVSRAAYPPGSSRGGTEQYDTTRRQAHEQIETLCSLPPPLVRQQAQQAQRGVATSNSGAAMPPGTAEQRNYSSLSHQAMLSRPLEPVEPAVKPKLAGLMHSDVTAYYDQVSPSDARMLNRMPPTRDELEYSQYVQRQPRTAMTSQQQQQPQQQQRFGPQMISPSAGGSGVQRVIQQSEPATSDQATFHGQRAGRAAVESPLDLSLRRDEPATMTAEAFLRRVQDPERYVVSRESRPDYTSRNMYSIGQDVEMETMMRVDARRPEYRQQQQYQQHLPATEAALTGVQQHHHLQQQQQHTRHESPRTRLEAMPDWVSSRAPPVSHVVEQQQRVAPSQSGRRPVLVEGHRAPPNHVGVSPVESRTHHLETSHGTYGESRPHDAAAAAAADEAMAVWDRRVSLAEKSRMQSSSWEVPYSVSMRTSGGGGGGGGGGPTISSNIPRTDNRPPMVGGMAGANLRMPNPPHSVCQSSPSTMGYESSRPQQVYYQRPVSVGSQQMSNSGAPGVLVAAGSTSWMSKDRQDRLDRQERQVSEAGMPAEWDARRMRGFESNPNRLSSVDVGPVPVDSGLCRGTSSPSLPQLSPIPSSTSSTSLSANAAESRRKPMVQLLGSHSPSDILHLRCNVCSLTYGSLRSFRMHFFKVHGVEPGPEHFTIQTISETRTALAQGVTGGQQDLNTLDCTDDSSLPPPSLTRETGEMMTNDVRCAATQLIDANSLEQQQLQHRQREFLPQVKQVAEVYPIPKKTSSVVCRPSEPTTPPEKPSPPLSITTKRLSPSDEDNEMKCHKCHQFSTRDWAMYRRHIKMHGAPDVAPDQKIVAGMVDVECIDAADVGCAVCLEGFSDVADWQSHVRTSHQTSECMMRSCACKSCDLGFTNAGALRRHLSAVHGMMTSKSGTVAAIEVEYRCLFCPDTFNDERTLYLHTQAHEHNYMLQRSSSSSLTLSRRYSFLHGAKLTSESGVHCVQTAVPDTTCPEELRTSNDTVVSAGNSKSGSDDGASVTSDKSPEADVVEDGRSLPRVTTKQIAKRPLSGSDDKMTSQWTPRSDSLKASILRRLSANQEAAVVVGKKTSNPAENSVGSPSAIHPVDESESARASSPLSDRSAQPPIQTVFGDLVSLMHRTVENSLRGFSAEPTPPSMCSTSVSPPVDTILVPIVSQDGSPPCSSRPATRCVRDVCDAIIANSFRQTDESVLQTWPSSGSGDYLSELSRNSSPEVLPQPSTSPNSPTSPSKDNDAPLNGSDRSSVSRTSSRSDTGSTTRKSSGNVRETRANKNDVESVLHKRTETVDDCNGASKSDVIFAADDRLEQTETVSDSENQASDIDDQPPLCIDLNRETSDDEQGSPSSHAAGEQEVSANSDEKVSGGSAPDEVDVPVESPRSRSLVGETTAVSDDCDMREKPFRKRKLETDWDSGIEQKKTA